MPVRLVAAIKRRAPLCRLYVASRSDALECCRLGCGMTLPMAEPRRCDAASGCWCCSRRRVVVARQLNTATLPDGSDEGRVNDQPAIQGGEATVPAAKRLRAGASLSCISTRAGGPRLTYCRLDTAPRKRSPGSPAGPHHPSVDRQGRAPGTGPMTCPLEHPVPRSLVA